MLRAVLLLILAMASPTAERLSPRFVFVNSWYVAQLGPRLPDSVAIVVLWPDGRLQHVDCVVRPGTRKGTVRVFLDGSAQVATGRWAGTKYGAIGVKIRRFNAYSTSGLGSAPIDGELRVDGYAKGRAAAHCERDVRGCCGHRESVRARGISGTSTTEG